MLKPCSFHPAVPTMEDIYLCHMRGSSLDGSIHPMFSLLGNRKMATLLVKNAVVELCYTS